MDWNHLGGFTGFEGRGKRYDLMLFSENTSLAELEKARKAGYRVDVPEIPRLPDLAAKGAAYMVTSGDDKNENAMEFIEGHS